MHRRRGFVVPKIRSRAGAGASLAVAACAVLALAASPAQAALRLDQRPVPAPAHLVKLGHRLALSVPVRYDNPATRRDRKEWAVDRAGARQRARVSLTLYRPGAHGRRLARLREALSLPILPFGAQIPHDHLLWLPRRLTRRIARYRRHGVAALRYRLRVDQRLVLAGAARPAPGAMASGASAGTRRSVLVPGSVSLKVANAKSSEELPFPQYEVFYHSPDSDISLRLGELPSGKWYVEMATIGDPCEGQRELTVQSGIDWYYLGGPIYGNPISHTSTPPPPPGYETGGFVNPDGSFTLTGLGSWDTVQGPYREFGSDETITGTFSDNLRTVTVTTEPFKQGVGELTGDTSTEEKECLVGHRTATLTWAY
jgi:hypothetical protein